MNQCDERPPTYHLPPLSGNDLLWLDAVTRAASPGPWEALWGEDNTVNADQCYEQVYAVRNMNTFGEVTAGRVIVSVAVDKGSTDQLVAQANMRFIAAARDAVPRLLAMLAERDRKIAELEARLRA